MLGLQQEDGHLVAADGVGRAVVAAAAAAGDALGASASIQGAKVEEQGTSGKTAGAGRRRVAERRLGLQEEDRHLLARVAGATP